VSSGLFVPSLNGKAVRPTVMHRVFLHCAAQPGFKSMATYVSHLVCVCVCVELADGLRWADGATG